MDRYLATWRAVCASGVEAPLQVMQSRGGVSTSSVARERPVRLFLSGPAAGVIGGQFGRQWSASDDLITVDIGGTSSDIALIQRRQAAGPRRGRVAGYPCACRWST